MVETTTPEPARDRVADRVLRTLDEARRADRLAHAHLLCGPTGTADEVARAFAARLLCTGEPPAARACGSCPACDLVATSDHPDLHVLEPAEGKRRISLDRARSFRSALSLKPHRAEGRVVGLVRGADVLGRDAANALLKTVEEPPGPVRLLLSAVHIEDVLPTIRSRCQVHRLGAGTVDVPAERGAEVCGLALGRDPGREPGESPFDRASRIWETTEGETKEMRRGALVRGLVGLARHLRDVRGLQAAGDAVDPIGPAPDRREADARRMPPRGLERAVDRVLETAGEIDRNLQPELTLETLLLDLDDLLRPAGPGS